jgi:hypothetical protein
MGGKRFWLGGNQDKHNGLIRQAIRDGLDKR